MTKQLLINAFDMGCPVHLSHGFNVSYAISPGSFEELVELVIPELQRRGAFKREYREGSLRAKLHGRAHLSGSHPGYRYRPGLAPVIAAK